LAKWRSFVDSARESDVIPVLDGQLFHGDLTNLFLMDADVSTIAEYSRVVEGARGAAMTPAREER
jgi:hypothetical protein